jgi:hypothetical protein
VVDGTVGVELGTLVLGPGLVVATDFDELPPPEQAARISAPAATMTGMSSLPLRLRTRIRMYARYRPGEVGHPSGPLALGLNTCVMPHWRHGR